MIINASFSIAAFIRNIFMFNSLKREIEGGLGEAKKTATRCFAVFLALIIIGIGLSATTLKVNNDIRDEVRSGNESLQSEMQELAEANDEGRAEREALQSEMHAHLVEMGDEVRSGHESLQSEIQALAEANDEARAEHEAWQSEMRKFFWMTYGLMAVCTAAIVTVVAFGVTHIRKMEHRISGLEQKPDDPLLTSGKRVHHLRILSDSDSQAVRRTEGSPPAHQEKAR